jgi:hypothetical protein
MKYFQHGERGLHENPPALEMVSEGETGRGELIGTNNDSWSTKQGYPNVTRQNMNQITNGPVRLPKWNRKK